MISMKVGAAVLLLSAATAQTVKLQESGQVHIGGVAPSFGGWDLSGKSVLTFDKILKNPTPAPLLVTFGASYCVPCNLGLPRMVALQKKNPQMRLVLIDVESDQAAAQGFASKHGMEGPAVLDKFEGIAKSYGLQEDGKLALPRTFLVDAKGRVRAIYREEGADLEKVIEADLAATLESSALPTAPGAVAQPATSAQPAAAPAK